MLPWQFFSSALSSCSESLISNANLLTKVYFPRLIVPAAAVITNPAGFSLSMAIVALLVITGVRQFRRMEKRFADVI